MRYLRPWCVLAILVIPVSIVAQQPATDTDAWSLSPGDSVRISVWNRPELSGVSTTFLPNVPQVFVKVDRDKVLTASEAVAFGIVDEVIERASDVERADETG